MCIFLLFFSFFVFVFFGVGDIGLVWLLPWMAISVRVGHVIDKEMETAAERYTPKVEA